MPIYIYCRSGSRTSKTVALLQQLGIKEIVKLQYGLIDWQRSGYSLRLRH
ncbi:MAG: rhodanese-like domain-containing protein [Bacteroidales bacterium]|nr:rhodanese-like domain-containing protein [Bacteroidales bacterium]